MDAMQQKLLEAAIRLGISLPGASPAPSPISGITAPPKPVIETTAVPAQAETTSPAPVFTEEPVASFPQPVPVVDPAEMKPQWEKELDDMIAKNGGRLEIRLQSGAMLRVVAEPKPCADAHEISYDTFKRLSRAASILGGRVVDAMSKTEADAKTKAMVEKAQGFWASEHVFIEVDRTVGGSGYSGQVSTGVVSAPNTPPTTPSVDARLWITISGGSVIENVPMRVGTKVVGTLMKTTNGAIYARTAKPTDHKLSLYVPWAMSGGYTIEKEVYEKYLTDPNTVIKIIRDERIYLTTSAWIQKYGGVIKQWGSDRIVMPLSGNYWLVVNKEGEPTR